MVELSLSWLHLVWMIPVVLLIAYLGSPRFRGTIGEDRVRRLLSGSLPRSQYTIINDLVVPSGGGTRRIAHLVVSQFGLFVVRTVYRPGRITGTGVQDLWTQRRWGQIHRFDNPIHQNRLAIEALKARLDIPDVWFHSVVVFASDTSFKESSPEDVVPADKLIPLIKRRGQKLLEPDTCAEVLLKLKQVRLDSDKRTWPDRWGLLRWVLLLLLMAGSWILFREQLVALYSQVKSSVVTKSQSGSLQSERGQLSAQELWKRSLVCAWSPDTGRCACYEPAGDKVELDPEECRDLAEKGSVTTR